MGDLDLVSFAKDILSIHQDLPYRMSNYSKNIRNCKLETFTQVWGNTSGGFEGIGGSAMTEQRTYVIIPSGSTCEDTCYVYFNGGFAYQVKGSRELYDDVYEKRAVEGCSSYKRRYLTSP